MATGLKKTPGLIMWEATALEDGDARVTARHAHSGRVFSWVGTFSNPLEVATQLMSAVLIYGETFTLEQLSDAEDQVLAVIAPLVADGLLSEPELSA